MKKRKNYLDYIPKRNSYYQYTFNSQNHIEIHIPNQGLCNRIAQSFFQTSQIQPD